MAFHFFSSALMEDSMTASKIAAKVAEFMPRDIFVFLMTLGGSIDEHSTQTELEYPSYLQYKEFVCAKLKNGNMPNRSYSEIGDEKI